MTTIYLRVQVGSFRRARKCCEEQQWFFAKLVMRTMWSSANISIIYGYHHHQNEAESLVFFILQSIHGSAWICIKITTQLIIIQTMFLWHTVHNLLLLPLWRCGMHCHRRCYYVSLDCWTHLKNSEEKHIHIFACWKRISFPKYKHTHTHTRRDWVFACRRKRENSPMAEHIYTTMPHKPKNNCLQSIDFFAGNC